MRGGADSGNEAGSAVCSQACTAAAPDCCNGTCVDIQEDQHNCGACGHDCQGGDCKGGTCLPLLLASSRYQAYAIAVNAQGVYWTELNDDVVSVGLTGGTVTRLYSPGGIGIAALGSNVFFASVYLAFADTGSVMSVPKTGGTPQTLAANQNLPNGIAVDDTNIYWTDYSGGTVMKMAKTPVDGGAPVTLASGQDGPLGIAVDATSVYWTNEGGGSVVKIVKQ